MALMKSPPPGAGQEERAPNFGDDVWMPLLKAEAIAFLVAEDMHGGRDGGEWSVDLERDERWRWAIRQVSELLTQVTVVMYDNDEL